MEKESLLLDQQPIPDISVTQSDITTLCHSVNEMARKHAASDSQHCMKYNLPQRVLRDILRFAEKYHIQRVILFGSRARGTNTERSDIDIAICGGDFDGFYWDIKEHVHSLLWFDVVQIDTGISEELRRELERDGVTIYEKNR